MADVLAAIQRLVKQRDVQVSRHGYRELAADGIALTDVIGGVDFAVVVESYPDAVRGPSVLVLQNDRNGEPLHIVWGMLNGNEALAVLITAYRPDPARWTPDFKRRIDS
jgi:hypothetical protein